MLLWEAKNSELFAYSQTSPKIYFSVLDAREDHTLCIYQKNADAQGVEHKWQSLHYFKVVTVTCP